MQSVNDTAVEDHGPSFITHAMVDTEQVVRAVPALDVEESLVVGVPERVLPVLLEVVRLVDVTSCSRCNGPERCHGGSDPPSASGGHIEIRLVSGNTGEGGLLGRGDDDERTRSEHRWVDGGHAVTGHSLRFCAIERLVEMKTHMPVAACLED